MIICNASVNPISNLLFIYMYAQRQRSPSVHLVHRRGGTPCWLHFSWLLLAPAQNRFRVVRALRVFSGGRSVVRALTIIFLANVTVQGTRHFVEGTLEPIVLCFHNSGIWGFRMICLAPIACSRSSAVESCSSSITFNRPLWGS